MGPTHATNAMSAMNVEYAQMTDALRWQQQRIIELETENRELRRHLDDLRRGVGVSLIIEGCHIPLAPPAATPMHHPGAGAALDASQTSGVHPAISPTPALIPTPAPLPHPLTPQRVFPTHPPTYPTSTAPAQPPRRTSARHNEAASFPEHAWLTGPAPVVKPAPSFSQQQQPPQPARPLPHQESRRVESPQPPLQPRQRYNPPSWLREEAPTVASWETSPETTVPPHTRLPAQRQYLSSPHTSIESVPAEVWRAEQRQESGNFPTLAQITGKRPAVRIPGKRKKLGADHDDERSPFTDSFVLG